MKISIEWNGLTLKLDVDYDPVIPAKTWGAPEDCYPEDGGDLTINTMMLGESDMLFLLQFDEVCEDISNAVLDELEAGSCDGWVQ